VDETVTIRQTNGRVEWRRTSNTMDPFETIGINITNDANGDGTAEQMIIPDSTTNPKRITVRVTATSPSPTRRRSVDALHGQQRRSAAERALNRCGTIPSGGLRHVRVRV